MSTKDDEPDGMEKVLLPFEELETRTDRYPWTPLQYEYRMRSREERKHAERDRMRSVLMGAMWESTEPISLESEPIVSDDDAAPVILEQPPQPAPEPEPFPLVPVLVAVFLVSTLGSIVGMSAFGVAVWTIIRYFS